VKLYDPSIGPLVHHTGSPRSCRRSPPAAAFYSPWDTSLRPFSTSIASTPIFPTSPGSSSTTFPPLPTTGAPFPLINSTAGRTVPAAPPLQLTLTRFWPPPGAHRRGSAFPPLHPRRRRSPSPEQTGQTSVFPSDHGQGPRVKRYKSSGGYLQGL
jgi:hypothetical protein